jgi:hypothetical protein
MVTIKVTTTMSADAVFQLLNKCTHACCMHDKVLNKITVESQPKPKRKKDY